jgi:hypothetical protein
MKKICILLSLLFILCSRTANAQSGLFIAPSTSVFTSPVTGQSWLFNSTSKILEVWTGSAWLTKSYPFSNLTATGNPTASNDNTQGYVVGSFWINQTTQTLYMATSVGTSAAVWVGMNVVTSTIPLANIQQGGATNGQSLIWNNSLGEWQPANPAINLNQLLQSGATNGQVATWSTGSSAWIPSNAGAGTVTTFSSGNLSPLFTSSVANATSTPSLTFSLSNAGAGTIFSNTSGSSGAPAYNSLSITAGTGLSGGGNLTSSPTISLTNPVTVALGGSGAASLTAHNVLLGEGTSAFGVAAPATATYPLCSNGSTSDPSFQQLSLSSAGVTGTLPVANGGTNATTGTAAINNLITGSATSGQVLKYDGTNWVPSTVSGTGTVTSFSSGNLSPYFTTSVATSTTTPALTFTASNIAANTILSNTTGSGAIPAANALSITAGTGLSGGGNLTSSPTISLTTPVSNSNLGNTVVTSTGNLSPLFTANISAQTLGFTLSSVAAHAYLGNQSSSSAAPAFQTISAADLPTTTVNTTGNLSPLFTSSITGQALSFSFTNATGNSIFSNTSGSAATPAYNVLTITAGTGLTGGGNLTSSPTINLDTPVAIANGGTGTALFTSGKATFVSSGTVSVSDSSITSSSIIVVSQQGNGSALSEYYDVELTPGTGFTIHSSNSSSTAIVSYIRLK